jgi:hypothetical protein
MRLAIAYNTMNKLELTKQTFPVLRDGDHALLWSDGSTDPEALAFFEDHRNIATDSYDGVRGGADAAIAHALTRLLQHPANYAYVGIAESDVILDADWQIPTMELFKKGKADGLSVGAVSPRSYVDRILIQRSGYAVMFNLGAGIVIFTREAADIVLRSFRTAWWPDIVKLFAQLSGIDLRTYAAFRGGEHFLTTDWQFEAQIARHGLASLALTPAKVKMVGQNPPLEQQGLELTTRQVPADLPILVDQFNLYRTNIAALRRQETATELPGIIHRDGAGQLFFPHQLGYLAGGPTWQGTLELQWVQGFSPFAYRAGPGGASLSVRLSGSCSFLVSGGASGARVTIEDHRSGFKAQPDLPASNDYITITVPGGPIPRQVSCELAEGAVFYGLSTSDPQMLDSTFRFSWDQLPEAK